MSAFDPSLLEGKDRSELAAIAEQLGEKPGARAKKADIVALIMRLVGADAPEAAAEPAPEAPEAASSADTAPDADVDAAVATDEPEAEGDPEATEREAEAEASASDAPAGQPERTRRGGGREGSRDAGQNGQARNEGQGQGQRAPEADEVDPHNRADEPAPIGNPNQATGNQGQGGNGDQNGDESDSGNRRRRRRGRDRDRRPDEDQAHAEPVEVQGMVDLRDEGYGFLRLHGYLPSREDAYISVKQTRQFGLRTGDIVRGKSRAANRNEKNPALLQVDEVNGFQAHNQPARPAFGDLTPVFPTERLTLELADDPSNVTVRVLDLVAPIGKGTRGLLLAPPSSGATTLLKHLVRSIEVNHPEVELIVALVDERPEEVTDLERWLLRGTVAATTLDRSAEEHIALAELVIERAKRLVESGKDVVVVLDGLTRLARAHNLVAPAGGRTLPGGIDVRALHPTRRVFGAARKAEEGGSLTIVATVQVDTGALVDEVILDEFRGTGTTEVRLDRRLAERRTFPAIDIDASGTRHEDVLVGREQQAKLDELRRVLGGLTDASGSNSAAIEGLVERVSTTRSNAELLTKTTAG